ncbi:MAG TPA: hypothetical protein VFY29_12055 [Terriglobia bacterium]|nr:hypothetical protein [Terriglobia bacterium]
MKLRLLILLTVLTGIHLSDSRCAFGCDCLGPSLKQARHDANSIFSGTVKSIEWLPGASQRLVGSTERVTFSVSRIWKGSKLVERVVTTTFNTTCSMYDFSQNKEYLVYANGTEKDLSVRGCSRTILLKDAGEDLKALGPGEPPATLKRQ